MKSFFVYMSLLAFTLSCNKVPLHENPGSFEVLAAHYFENEKTQYVFFAVNGLKAEQVAPGWPSRFELKTNGVQSAALKPQPDGFAKLDYSNTVHRHHLVNCGPNRLCGSISFHADHPPEDMAIRFRYHENSPMKVEAGIDNSVHSAGLESSSQSALVYGVFNENNGRMQIRVHDNFGYPNSEELAQFGMERTFEVSGVTLTDFSLAEENAIAQKSGTALLFPADACEKAGAAGTPASFDFSGSSGWWPETLDTTANKGSACFRARILDSQGQTVAESWALARRNPVLEKQALSISSPIGETLKIPLVLAYCPNKPESATQTSALFLGYQRFILGIPDQGVDACFAIHEEERFSQDLDRVLNEKVAAAKRANPSKQDLFLTVVINHRLASNITVPHQIILERLDKILREERMLVSPRVVGAFIYDSDSLESRNLSAETPGMKSIVWCPRKDLDKSGKPITDPALANCASYRSGKIEAGPFVFQLPMGPFPTMSAYLDYVGKYGDRGLSRNPQFSARGIRTTENSVSGDGVQTYTFFDGERVSLKDGESLRFCADRDTSGILQSVMTRVTDFSSGAVETLAAKNAPNLTISGSANAADLNVELGLLWEYPFVGGITYELPVEGKVFDFIPIQTSVGNSQAIGDKKWLRPVWNIGGILQKCTRYCDHPIFDEAGNYQPGARWRTHVSRCPDPKPAEAP